MTKHEQMNRIENRGIVAIIRTDDASELINVVDAIRAGGVIALGAAVTAGFWGDPSPYKNLSPVLVWVIWWVGVVYACALIADLWSLMNPFRTLFAWAETIVSRCFDGPPVCSFVVLLASAIRRLYSYCETTRYIRGVQ